MLSFSVAAPQPEDRPQIRFARPERWGDVVLRRKDAPASYHLAVVVDDAFQGVTHVTRGTDMEAATDIHVLLQMLLGLPTPIYTFHRLILGTGRAQALQIQGRAGAEGFAGAGLDGAAGAGGAGVLELRALTVSTSSWGRGRCEPRVEASALDAPKSASRCGVTFGAGATGFRLLGNAPMLACRRPCASGR